ncbi:FecR domain-containing protein [Methylobacillus gramineus]|uniref:FecR domain-containing protein n=1 Tax=Methylobacillus gramineus TaxID=755169 RepID=UPI001CFFF2AB|nr:FecR domain-containing protein [Methylobacillus gramineus]MCB5185892.1 FecR domain-containing protein [Methylobacillus gramineus]
MSHGTSIDPRSIPPLVAQKAVEWMVELNNSNDAILQQQFAEWLSQHPDHQRAWQRIAEVNASLTGASTAIGSAMAQVAITRPQSSGRRRALKALSIVIFASGSGWIMTETDAWHSWRADENTEVGEYRTLILADGTRLMLNTNSAVNISFTHQHRYIELLKGEILVATAKDAQGRPMLVATRHGNLQPLGTRFHVKLDKDFSQVGVFEGRVAVRAAALPDQESIVMPGEFLIFNENTLGNIKPVSESSVAWVDGMIVASNMRLGDFLLELDRHRKGVIRCDPALSDMRISGSFPLQDTDLILKNLTNILPVKMQYITRYWVTLLPA